MDECIIDQTMQGYLDNQELAGAALIVRKGEQLLYNGQWGYARLKEQKLIDNQSIFRMMSMSKPVTAVAVLKLIEEGKIGLDDPAEKYIPKFKNCPVANDNRYIYDPKKLWKILLYKPFFSMDKVKTEAAVRPFTIRDLLSHSSGLEQGIVGLLQMMKTKENDFSLEDRVERLSHYVLGFQPGSDTGYSPCGGFDVLGYIIEIVTGVSFEEYLQREICQPLNMKNTTFFLTEEQKKHLVDVYKRKKNRLINVTGTKEDMYGILHQPEMSFEEGSGGLFSTLEDYDHFAQMLLNNGTFAGKEFLKPETVQLMHTEAQQKHLEPDPGMVWGLGVKIRQEPKKSGSYVTSETYGWSGAFGTHFVISPKDNIEAVFMTNRSDLGGSGSYISTEIEKMVFGIWGRE